jgi:hypothetical protein
VLDRRARALMERETLDEAELGALAGELRLPGAVPQVLQLV